jgi:hypothetical protein
MSPEEIQDKLKNVINSLIKDNPEAAKSDLHDVLAAKMRERIGVGEPEIEPEVTPDEPEVTTGE